MLGLGTGVWAATAQGEPSRGPDVGEILRVYRQQIRLSFVHPKKKKRLALIGVSNQTACIFLHRY
jgi:hypothetical protein